MSKLEIERLRVPLYNNQPILAPAYKDYNAPNEIVDKADDYTVVAETFAIDLTEAALNLTSGYKIAIWCDLKSDTVPPAPAGMVYGYNYYSFPGELKTVDQLLNWFYEILHKKTLPFDLGVIDLDGEDLFSLTIPPATYTASYQSGYFKVYFNEILARVLTELWTGDPVQTAGESYYKMKTEGSGTTKQTVSKLHLVNKIESILIITTLPVTPTYIFDSAIGVNRPEKILASVELNALEYNLRLKTDWKYVPTVYRHATFSNDKMIMNFALWAMVQYVDGERRACYLRPGERFNVNLAFYPRGESF